MLFDDGRVVFDKFLLRYIFSFVRFYVHAYCK